MVSVQPFRLATGVSQPRGRRSLRTRHPKAPGDCRGGALNFQIEKFSTWLAPVEVTLSPHSRLTIRVMSTVLRATWVSQYRKLAPPPRSSMTPTWWRPTALVSPWPVVGPSMMPVWLINWAAGSSPYVVESVVVP